MAGDADPFVDPAARQPVVLIVDSDPDARSSVESALRRRFGADYKVMSADSAEQGLRTLEELKRVGDDVALVAADLKLAEMEGIEFLECARGMYSTAIRVLLTAMDRRGTRIPFTSLDIIQKATALGRIDFSLLKGWEFPEELLYPQVQEALTKWTRANRPKHEVIRVVGSQWDSRSHELRDALGRNTVPFRFHTADSDVGQRMIRDYGVDEARLPVVILHDGSVLHNPRMDDVAAALGVQTTPSAEIYDVAILGAGPAGLASSVYGASEGLKTLVIEPMAFGGQAGTSSMIRNYLGFPRGISGGDLAFRAWEQSLLFGAQFVFTLRATGISPRSNLHSITLTDGSEAKARAVVLALGVEYRRLGIPALERLQGAGVYYGAAGVEAPALVGEDVFVIGGANSAGQVALHLANFASQVTVVIRGESLEAGMSEYLVTQLHSTANIRIRLRTRVADGGGTIRLETLTLEDVQTGQREEVHAAAVFIMIGADARTEWLPDTIQRDTSGYVLTDHHIALDTWPLHRPPYMFETSAPGIFAVGDVRHGSVKRVAGAVGEGSVAVSSIHAYLAHQASLSEAEG